MLQIKMIYVGEPALGLPTVMIRILRKNEATLHSVFHQFFRTAKGGPYKPTTN